MNGPTTPGSDDTDVLEAFIPGQDKNLTWNTTQPISGKPILVYVYNGHRFEGAGFDYSKAMELKVFKNADVVRESHRFVCEKICSDDHEFTRKVLGREPVHEFLGKMTRAELRNVQVALLDSNGGVIQVFDDAKDVKEGAPAFLRALHKAEKENEHRLASAGG